MAEPAIRTDDRSAGMGNEPERDGAEGHATWRGAGSGTIPLLHRSKANSSSLVSTRPSGPSLGVVDGAQGGHLDVKIKSLGPNWMINDSAYRRNPKHYARIKLYNTTGFMVNGRLVARWAVPGYIRFKNRPYFDLDDPERVVGRTFRCSQVGTVEGKRTLLVLDEAPAGSAATWYLVWTTSRETGCIDLLSMEPPGNRRVILAASSYGLEQNVLWLLRDQSTFRASKGVFLFDQTSESLRRMHP